MQYERGQWDSARRVFETYVPEDDRGSVGRTLVSRWARHNPDAAADWIDGQDPEWGSYLRRELVSDWSRTDTEAAVDYVLSLEDREQREYLLTVAITDESDPVHAERAFYAMEDPESRVSAVQRLVFVLRRSDPQRAAELREQYGLKDLGDYVVEEVIVP